MGTATDDEARTATTSSDRTRLPAAGTPADDLRRLMDEAAAGDADWLARDGGGDELSGRRRRARGRQGGVPPLLLDERAPAASTFPSLARFEREVIDYAAGLFHGPDAVGSITSGGSEIDPDGRQVRPRPRPTIASRDHARREMVVPGLGPPGVHEGGPLLRPDEP